MNQMLPPLCSETDESALAGLEAEIRTRREEFEKRGHIPRDIVNALKKIGVYRAFVPKSLGGDEISPAAFCRLIERISKADASTGWVASFGISTMYLGALSNDVFESLYRENPNLTFAGALFPPQAAQEMPGGLLVSGRWPYCSGCMGADLIGVGTKGSEQTGGLPRMTVMRADQVRIDQTWDTVGLQATGSHDIVVDKVFVTHEMTFVRGGPTHRQEPIFRYPAMSLAAQVLAVVGLGTAREALDYIYAQTSGKSSITGAPAGGTRPYLQAGLAQAEATLSGARAYFYDTIETAWAQILRGDKISPEMNVKLRLAATQAARSGATAARMAFELGGTEALRRGHVLNRCLIDAAAVAQHAFIGVGTWTLAGAGLLQQPTPPGYP